MEIRFAPADAIIERLASSAELGVDDNSRVRSWCGRSPEEWLAGEGYDYEILTPAEAEREDVMLGMRLTRGVAADQVEHAGLTPTMESLQRQGLVVLDGAGRSGRWRTTTQGWLLGNEVFGQVWNAEDDSCEPPVA